jgi:rare lipoprotein A
MQNYPEMKNIFRIPMTVLCFGILAGCAAPPRFASTPAGKNTAGAGERHIEAGMIDIVPQGYTETGVASYYNLEFKGKKTSNGERFDPSQFTAAHRTLPFNTIVRVTNVSNHLSVDVRINDRGPFKKNRIIDLSYAAAKRIGLVRTGFAKVRMSVVKAP